MTDLSIERTAIPGLLVVHLPVHLDSRGWFKENWQREKMVALGLPDFVPVQQNVSFNAEAGITRGIHAEPWDKLVSVTTGRVFGAWVDLREGATFGTTVTHELTPETAVFVPRGVGNAYQTLVPDTAYSYLVNDHWSPAMRDRYTFVNLGDPSLAIEWPLPLATEHLSAADFAHPPLSAVAPFRPQRPLVLGAGGQLGRALRTAFPTAEFLTRDAYDLADPVGAGRVAWDDHDLVINAAAYTAVDAAETPEGRREAWAANVDGVRRLAQVARARAEDARALLQRLRLRRHAARATTRTSPLSPLGVYGQTKAAGDALVADLPHAYVVRTSWVIGDGHNFVRTMQRLARDGVSPSVVDDQVGRPTFATDLALAVRHLVQSQAPSGTYNVTSSGEPTSWAGLAREVFAASGRDPGDVTGVSTEEYAAGRPQAPRPRHSTLDLARIEGTGLTPTPWREALAAYLERPLQ